MSNLKFLGILSLFLLLPLNLLAQEIDFLVQGNTYTPPFYKGKTVWSNQSQVIITAIVNLPNPLNLNYRWSKNNIVLGTASGLGKNSLTFSDTVLGKPQEILLEVLSADGSLVSSSIIDLVPVPPVVLVYENNPLYGFLFNNAILGSYTMKNNERTLGAFPFFFSVFGRADKDIRYSWKTNTGETTGSTVTYRAPERASGTSNVNLEIYNDQRIMQSAFKSFQVEFDL